MCDADLDFELSPRQRELWDVIKAVAGGIPSANVNVEADHSFFRVQIAPDGSEPCGVELWIPPTDKDLLLVGTKADGPCWEIWQRGRKRTELVRTLAGAASTGGVSISRKRRWLSLGFVARSRAEFRFGEKRVSFSR